jgi:hypothetical protein
VSPDAPNEYTGEQFLGAILGDHVKTAICTRIMTGPIVHTGSMLAQTAAVTGCVPAFSWCTDEGTQRFRLSKFTEVATAMIGRRGLKTQRGVSEAAGKFARSGRGEEG